MAGIEGIGGVFIYSQNAEALTNWYVETLGVAMEPHPDGNGHFCVFWTRDYVTSQPRENPVFAIIPSTDNLDPATTGYTLAFRVDDLEAYLDELQSKGVTIEENRLVWERGKHGWIIDPDGNRVELYEEVFPAKTD